MNFEVNRILVPLIIALITTSALFIIRGISFKLLHKWAEKTETKLDDIIIKSFRIPSIYWCLAIGLYIGVDISELPKIYTSSNNLSKGGERLAEIMVCKFIHNICIM